MTQAESPKSDVRCPLNVGPEDVRRDPFPHVVKDAFIAPDLYRRMRDEFPADALFDASAGPGGRAGRDLYRGDEQYDQLLRESPAWREFYDFINSPAYIAFAMTLFGDHMADFGCKVDRSSVGFVDYVEPRSELADRSRLGRKVQEMKRRLASGKGMNDMFVRLDIEQGAKGYGKPVHCDRHNRLTSMLVYFCDADEIGLEGGELIVHEHQEKKPYPSYERHPDPDVTREVMRLRPAHNRGIFFLCSNNSYHSATEVRQQERFRDFVYISISSRAPACW